MSKNEFLKELRDYLTGNVSASEVEDSVRYYDNYIDGQVRGGQSESQVTAGLGDPRIIGKSIVDASGRKKTVYESGGGDAGPKDTGKGAGSRAGKLKLYGIIALVILIVLVVLIAITKVVAFFFPLIVVILIITMIFRRGGGGR